MSDVIRVAPMLGFTPLPNPTICDRRLSLRTLGLLMVMMSRPEGWDYSVKGLAVYCGVSRDVIRKSLVELEEAGYLRRRQLHGTKGTFGGNEYIIRDIASAEDAESLVGQAGEPLPKKPATAEPSAVKPAPDFSPQSNTRLNTNTPLNPPKGGKRSRKEEPAPDWRPELFERFWRYYPHDYRGNKQRARRAWNLLQPAKATLTALAYALERHKKSKRWEEGIGIPNASTFINPANGYWDLTDAERAEDTPQDGPGDEGRLREWT